jgi:hypothetical protein
MGYTTDFEGAFTITPPLTPEHRAYLERFAYVRHMARNAELTAKRPDPIREAAGLPVGEQGGYFVGAEGEYGQVDSAPDITNYNRPPTGQPGLWCQWVPNEDGTALQWDENEKFYQYIPWLHYLLDHFLTPWGYTLNGEVTWEGEHGDDAGMIRVADNVVTVLDAQRVYVEREP